MEAKTNYSDKSQLSTDSKYELVKIETLKSGD